MYLSHATGKKRRIDVRQRLGSGWKRGKRFLAQPHELERRPAKTNLSPVVFEPFAVYLTVRGRPDDLQEAQSWDHQGPFFLDLRGKFRPGPKLRVRPTNSQFVPHHLPNTVSHDANSNSP